MTTKTMLPAVLAALLTPGLAGCGEEAGPARVTFEVEVQGKGSAGLANDHGYSVTLTRASLHLGPVYFYSGEPLFTRRGGEAWPWRLARAALGIGTAHAHPGHYQEGDALAEVLSTGSFDLLAAKPARLGTAAGVTGAYRSAQVNLSPAPSGHTVEVAGSASKGSHQVTFSATLDLSEKVKGIAFGAEVGASPGLVRVEVDLARWLELVDFSKLGGAGPVTFGKGSQADNALQRGVTNTAAFIPSWMPGTH